MDPAQLFALIEKTPAALAELSAVGLAVSAAVGACGTAVEHLGATLARPGLEKFGQRLEAWGTDFPKLWRGSRYTAETKAAGS